MTSVPTNIPLTALPYGVHKDLCLKLEKDSAWLTMADFLIDMGVSLNIEDLRSHNNSVDRLLHELDNRRCNVGNLCSILESCRLYHALAVLKCPEPVRILKQPGDDKDHINVPDGGALELECEAWSLPPPFYKWYRDNEELPDAISNKLRIEDFSPELEGHYYCMIRHELQDLQEICTKEINVCVAPYLSEITEQPEGVTRQEGETICLKCVVSGHPVPKYEWYKENKLLEDHMKSTLYINYAKPEDSGLYRCIVSNKAGEVMSATVSVKVIQLDIPRLKLSERCTAKEKIALLIGNVKYKNHDHLVKPVDDVVLLSKKLTEVGFKVISLENLRLVEMRNALRHFSHQLTPGVYGLFYFGGHGVQSDERLMLPIDAPKDYNSEHCLSEKEVKDTMLSKNPTLRVIILDMCLRAPYKSLEKVAPKPTCQENNFPCQPDINLIQAYSTSGNLSAYERRSESNGTYVKHLSQFINEEIAIMGVFQKTNEAIYNETIKMKEVQQQQIPTLSSNVYKKFSFTDQVSGDNDIECFFNSVYVPPNRQELDFNPSIQIEPRPMVSFFPYRGCILNAIEIEIKGIDLDVWKIKISSQKEILQMEDVPIKECREKDILRVVVEDIQGPAAAGNINLTVNLKDQHDCLVASTPLFLDKPLVAKWFLWFEPDDP